jgi:hypothetical protein
MSGHLNDDDQAMVVFAGDGLSGEFTPAHVPAGGLVEVARLIDPSASLETIHWGRNYIYAAELHTESGRVPVVVKQFSNQGLKRRLDRWWRGSKAARSWRVAKELIDKDLPTPEPVLWVESDDPEGPSFFIARRLEGAVEVRHFFRRLNGELGDDDCPEVDSAVFLGRLGALARRVNDAGILYRDLSMGNILAVDADGGFELYLIDFNRARTGRRLGTYNRTRDICRLPVLGRKNQSVFLAGYWGATPPPGSTVCRFAPTSSNTTSKSGCVDFG